uniref:Uncharacterized protein n=1 Tax=Pelusios castaneus TaxID=367368 RepID=A0A8C8VIU4_9SAUR
MWCLLPTPLCLISVFLLLQAPVAEVFLYVVYKQNSTCMDFRALSACFGPPVPREGLRGYLTEAAPANACQPIGSPPASSNSSEVFIALIRRSGCPFGVKVLHAQQAGYKAAIVHNVNAEQLVSMVADDKEIRQQIAIQSVFMGKSASKHLKRASRYEKGQFWSHLLKYSAYIVIPYVIQEFGFMINVVVCTITLVVCARWYKKGQKITVCTFKRGDKYDTCVICMAEYEDGDQLKILPCSHAWNTHTQILV